jgi:hypothetical protein
MAIPLPQRSALKGCGLQKTPVRPPQCHWQPLPPRRTRCYIVATAGQFAAAAGHHLAGPLLVASALLAANPNAREVSVATGLLAKVGLSISSLQHAPIIASSYLTSLA